MKLKDPKAPKKEVLPQLELEVEDTAPVVDDSVLQDEDDTVFYFTNVTNEDWSTQWNKVKYTFPAQRRTRMAIRGESPENVQNIRKMFATRFAVDQFSKTKEFEKRNTPMENKSPIPYNLTVLQPFIDSCLKPLPKAKLISEEVASEDTGYQGDTKPLDTASSAPYDVFRDAKVKQYGEMPTN